MKRFSQVDYGIKHSAYGHLPLELCFVECALARADGALGSAAAAATTGDPAARPRPTPPAGGYPAPEQAATGAPPPARLPTPIRADVAAARPTDPDPPAPTAVPPHPLDTRPVAAPVAPDSPPPAPAAAPPAAVAPPPAPPAAASAPPVSPPAGTTTAASVTIDQVADLWPRIRRDLKAINRRVEALLSSADPWSVEDGLLTIVASHEFHRKKLNEDGARTVVEEVVSRLLGGPYRIACVGRDEAGPAPAPRAAAPPTPPAPPAATEAIATQDGRCSASSAVSPSWIAWRRPGNDVWAGAESDPHATRRCRRP